MNFFFYNARATSLQAVYLQDHSMFTVLPSQPEPIKACKGLHHTSIKGPFILERLSYIESALMVMDDTHRRTHIADRLKRCIRSSPIQGKAGTTSATPAPQFSAAVSN